MTNRILLCILSFLLLQTAQAQSFSISGKIVEKSDTSGLVGVNVFLTPISDSTQKNGTATDADGRFTIDNVSPGQYRLIVSYVGFNRYERNVSVLNQNVNLGRIQLQTGSTTLQSVVVQGQALQVTQTGDTTQFNANAYKTHPDATAEDLLTKMPGVTSENGSLKVNGEDVQEVTVDGRPFFGDDPNAAIKNLPSEIIDKIQVFDKQSDQEQFTGFNSGNTRKAVNIVTKRGRNNGQFGKVFAGYGTDNRYTAGGSINFFNGARRISVIGLSNNINQQNFSTEDLFGVLGNQGGQNRGGGGPRGGGRGMNGRGGSRGSGGYSGDGAGSFNGRSGNAGNFLVGQQGGITTTNSIGLNYSDEWGKKIKVSGSYFFNNTNNDNNTQLTRQYVTAADSNLVYKENSATNTKNLNHRINARLEYTIDSSNSLLIIPKLSFQNHHSKSTLTGISSFADVISSQTDNTNTADNTGYNLSNNILFRHKFAKRGRTFSVNIGTQANNRNGDGTLYSLNQYIGSDTTLLDQRYDLTTKGYTLSGDLNYTEPISLKSQLMISYSPSYTSNNSDKETFDRNPTSDQYDLHDTLLSNKFDNTYTTHSGRISYRHSDTNYNFNIGLNGQYASLDGQQTYPHAFSIQRTFTNLLPNAMFMYRFSRTKNLRIMYRTSTNPPTITQLQNVVDITNPLLLKTGNPTLKQDYDHNIILRYGATNTKTAHNFFAFGMVQVTQNYIGNATFIPTKDTAFENGIRVNKGSQLNMPVNLNGYMNARTFLTYGFPVKAIKSNLNLNAGFTYSHAPALINNETNFSNNYTITGGFTVGSNISENVDFTLTYSGNYNIVKNTLQTDLDNTFYQQNTSLKFNWIFLKGFVFNTNLNHTLYTGLTQNFNQSFLLWNASFGYKFLKNRSLDARISVNDILNQNKAISRTVTETYIEDSFTQVLQRYFMFTLTYTLRNFRNNKSMQ